MDRKILFLKRSLIAEIIFGILLATSTAAFMITMANDNPNSTLTDGILGALFAFCVVVLPLVVLPIFSIRELNEYPEQKNLLINYVNSGVAVGFVFFPLAIWQIYTLVKLKTFFPAEKKS